MPHIVTTAELAGLIRPFVRAKIDRVPDPASRYGGYLPRRAAVDILHCCNSIDADVRAVGAEGVYLFFYNGCELVLWSAIRKVTVAGLDADGERTGQTVYDVSEPVRAAA